MPCVSHFWFCAGLLMDFKNKSGLGLSIEERESI